MTDHLQSAKDLLAQAHACLQDAAYHMEELDLDDDATDADVLAAETVALLRSVGGSEP